METPKTKTTHPSSHLGVVHDLLWDHDSEACDALLDFLPQRIVRRLLDAWLDDQAEDDETKRSSWYHGKL